MTKLNKTHTGLLRAAAETPDEGIDAPEDAKTFAALIKCGLVISIPQPAGGSRLLITEAGRAAIGEHTAETAAKPTPEKILPPAPKGKIGILVTLLRRAEGATIDAMMIATGWQAHSVRGAMSGSVKKALGLNVTSEKTENGRLCRIVDAAGA